MEKIIISMLLCSILLFGCIDLGGGSQEVPDETVEEPEVKENVPNPAFNIVSPLDGETITSDEEFSEVTVSIAVQNLVLKTPGGSAKKGEGHFHFVLDNGDPVIVTTKTYTLKGLESGEHTLKVELMNNDHTPYSPSVKRTVKFTIEGGAREYEPTDYTVKIKDFSYEPANIVVNVGDRVTWVNEGAYPRSATCSGKFDTMVIAPKQNATITMDQPLDCEYFSLTHMAMKGHIKVEKVE